MTCIRNPVGWFEIYVQDMPRARAFYEAVLGVTLEQLGMENPELWAFPAKPDQFGCGGALVHMPGIPSGGNSTLVYFSCDDCDSEAKKAAQAGALIAGVSLIAGANSNRAFGTIASLAGTGAGVGDGSGDDAPPPSGQFTAVC